MNWTVTQKAKNIANTQLKVFNTFKNKYPNADKYELYMKIIQLSPGYETQDKAHSLIDFARKLSEQRDGVMGAEVNFMWIVTAMCVSELNDGARISGEKLTSIYNGVFRVISEEDDNNNSKHNPSEDETSDYLMNKYSFLFDVNNKPLKDSNSIQHYATTLDDVAYGAVRSLHNNNHVKVNDDESLGLASVVAQFCLVILVRHLIAKDKTEEQVNEVVDVILKHLAKLWSSSDEQRLYGLLNKDTHRRLKLFVDLPVASKSNSQEGTLLWEYGKLTAAIAGKNPKEDLEAILSCVTVITEASEKMKPNVEDVIKSLK